MRGKDEKRRYLEQLLMLNNVDIEELIEIISELRPLADCTQNHPAHCYTVLEHTMKVVETVPDNPILKLTALLHDIGKPAAKVTTEDGVEHFWGHEFKSAVIAKEILLKLEYDEALIDKVCKLIELHDTKIEPSRHGIEEMLKVMDMEELALLLTHQEADLMAHSPSYISRKLDDLKKVQEAYAMLKSEQTEKLNDKEIEQIIRNVKASLTVDGIL